MAGLPFVCVRPRNTYWLTNPTLPVSVCGDLGSADGCARAGESAAVCVAAARLRRRRVLFTALPFRLSLARRVEREIEHQHVDARLAEEAELPPLRVLRNELVDLRRVDIARLGDPFDLVFGRSG